MKRINNFVKPVLIGCLMLLTLNTSIFYGCSNNEFKESSIEAGKILFKATKLLNAKNYRNVIERGNISSTVITFSNTTAKKYIESKKDEIFTYYNIIKKNNLSNSKDDDSLYMLSLVNEMLKFLIGESFENRCIYLEKIRFNRTTRISNWLVDEVFSIFLINRQNKNEWKSKSENEKKTEIREFLLVGYRDAGCQPGKK